MAWVKIETELVRHPKIMALPEADRAAALGFYVGLLAYCSELLTDGHVTRSVALGIGEELGLSGHRSRRSNAKNLLENLERVHLLERLSATRYVIHDYAEHQQTREQVLENREKERTRKRAQRGSERQTTLDVPQFVPPDVPPGQPPGSPTGTEGGTPARMRAGAEAAAEQEKGTSGSPPRDQPVDNRPAGWPDDPLLDPAAAADAAAPTEPQLTKLLQAFPDADRSSLTVIQPLAQALPAQTVLEIAWQLRRRKKPGGIGLLVDRLRDTIRERIATAAVENGQPAFDTTSRIERLKRDDPRSYVTAMAAALEPDDIAAYLDRHVPNEDDRLELADLAADLRRDHLST